MTESKNKLSCDPILLPLDMEKTAPKECVGMIFKNTNGVLSILTDLDDIIKSNGYFGAAPHHLYLTNQEKAPTKWYYDDFNKKIKNTGGAQYAKSEHVHPIIATTDKSLGLPLIGEDFLKEYVFDQNMKIEIETEREDINPFYRAGGGPVSDLQVPKIKADNTVVIVRPAKSMKTSWSKEEVLQLEQRWEDECMDKYATTDISALFSMPFKEWFNKL